VVSSEEDAPVTRYTYSEESWKEMRDYALSLKAERDTLRDRLRAMTKWLEKNQPDVFRRGLWDAAP
jgi:hypothetical protein